MNRLPLICGLVAVAMGWFVVSPAATAAGAPRPALVPGGDIFDHPTVLEFHLQLAATNLQALREHAREYTSATVIVNGQSFTNVGVKLKGAAGSFRPVDDQPALTLHFSRWVEGRRVFGLRRLHLNNSVQDSSFMNEYLGSELYRAAGVPTPRVAWAIVHLNGRKLGLYVLKEAFEKEFLRTFFGSADGTLYEGGFVRDIDQALDLEVGSGRGEREDLKALLAAAREPDLTNRWEQLRRLVDVDRFARYAALAVMLCDWDGYPINRNNYRVYFRPSDGRAVFLPHGMDQLFQRTSMELDQGWSGLMAWSLFDTPQGQELYQASCRDVFARVFRLENITNTIARIADTLRPVLPDADQRAWQLREQVAWRYRYLRRQPELKGLDVVPPPPAVAGQPADAFRPEQWRQQPGGDARLEGPITAEGKRVLLVSANNVSDASWRGEVKLQAGRYRFEGRVRTKGVQATQDEKGGGAGLRISSFAQVKTSRLDGDADWTLLAYDFDVPAPAATVTLVCELRARRGQVWFDVDSLRVIPVAK